MIEEKEEKWRIIPIPGNEKYQISNLGRIRNEKTKRILKKRLRTDGYEEIRLQIHSRKTSHSVHRLVAQAFIPNPNDFPQVNHKDKNRANNRVENLEWATQSMNIKHSIETGAKRYKRAVWRRDLEGGNEVIFNSIKEAAKVTECDSSSISKCVNGKQKTAGGYEWGYIEEKIKEEARKDIASIEIKGYTKYLIYNNGQIYSKKRKIYLKPSISNGYYRIALSNDNSIITNQQIHILVAKYFCDNFDNKPIVNHQDGNKLNNHYTNLEWVTHSENTKHAYNIGLNKRVSKPVNQYVREDKEKRVILRTFNSLKEAGEFLKVKNGIPNISRVCSDQRETAYDYRWGYA